MYFSGIDQHKAFSVITTLAADGGRVAQASLPNDRAPLLGYFAQFPGPHRAVGEATGRWYWLRDLPPLYQLQARLHTAQAELLAAQVQELEHAVQGALLEDAAVQRLLWIPDRP